MQFDNAREMNEFDWERQLREDDERLVSSMLEIPSVIDLPGEDDLLRKRLQRKLSKVYKQAEWDFSIEDDDFMDYEDIMFPDNWRDLPEADIYDRVEFLMRNWCAIYATKLPSDYNSAGIRTLCLYGRILGFSIDLVDMGGEKPIALKIALCKRLAKDLDRVFGVIDSIDFENRVLEKHKSRLVATRSEVLRLLFRLQHENNRD